MCFIHEFCSQKRSLFFSLSPSAAALISIQTPSRSLSRSVQDDVFFTVDVHCYGTPAILWTFTSWSSSRTVASWQQGVYTNVSADYSGRVQMHLNGSLMLLELRLQDAGVYVLTVTEDGGSSKDAVLLLKVKGQQLQSPSQGWHEHNCLQLDFPFLLYIFLHLFLIHIIVLPLHDIVAVICPMGD